MPNKLKFTEAPHTELNLAEGEDKWQEIIRVGNWSNSYKQFEITTDTLNDFVKNFEDNVLRTSDNTIQFNYAHNSWEEASGWITELKVENDVLLGKVKWTSDAKKKIKEGAWKFVSAEISWEYVDQETNKTYKNVLTGSALTNIPFVKGMKSVEASETHKTDDAQNNGNNTNLLSNTMDLSEQLAEVQTKNTELSAKLSEAETKLSEAVTAKTEAETKLSEKLAEVRNTKETARVDALLAEAKILPAEKEVILSTLLSLDEEKATALYEVMKAGTAKVDLSEKGGSTGDANLSAQDKYKEFSEKNSDLSELDKIAKFSEKFPEEAKQL